MGVLLDAYVIILYLCAFQLLQFIRILITVEETKNLSLLLLYQEAASHWLRNKFG